jgi:hypothetical protein
MKRYLWILALAIVAVAQEGVVELATPTLGYIFDEKARALRPIEGVPGAAAIGGRMHLGAELDYAAVSPSRSYAFGYESGEESLLLLRLDGITGASNVSTLPRARAWFSASGEVAAFDLGDRVETWGGLPNQPRRIGEMATGSLSIERLAVSDDGGMVAALAAGDLYRLTTDSPELLDRGVRDAAFQRGTRDLMALGATSLILYGKAEAENRRILLTGLDDARAFAVSRDQKKVAIAGPNVTIANLHTDQVAHLETGETSFDTIARVEGDAVFQLRSASGEVWLLDADIEPRLLALATRGDQ